MDRSRTKERKQRKRRKGANNHFLMVNEKK